MERSMCIRSDIGGWVLARSLAAIPCFRNGLTINIGAVALLADFSSSVEAANFSKAEANPSGYLVYRAEEESARYSLLLEIAK